MKTTFIKPADGLAVRDPAGGHLAEAGKDVELNSYWRRRLRDGDVVKARSKPKQEKADA